MNTCDWCGDTHGTDQLCQRAQRGMTRRSFCFLFGVGVAGVAVGVPTVECMTMTAHGRGTYFYKIEFVTVDGQVIPFDDRLAAKIASARGFR